MKLIWFPEPFDGKEGFGEDVLPTCKVAVETAVVRHGTPLFLPGWSESWRGVTGVGVVIDRLGRHIDKRFAHRYYNRIVIAVKAMPDNELYLTPEYAAALFSHDGSILVSKPIELEQLDQLEPKLTSLLADNIVSRLDSTVAAASRAFILHTGDVIIAGETGQFPLESESRISLCVGEQMILSHKIK